MAFVPGTRRDLGRDRKRLRAGWIGIVVSKVVDHLLDPDGVTGRTLPIPQKTPDVAVRGAIDVDRKGGERILGDGEELVLHDPAVLLRIELRRINGCTQSDRLRLGIAADDAAGYTADNSARHAAVDGFAGHRRRGGR